MKIPCTVGILTRNSAATLGRALKSVCDFDDIIVCDGGSTDGTLDIARARGARIIEQEQRFLDEEGRVVDYAGVRNQTLRLASQQWFFFLDSDEYLTPELAEEIRRVTCGEPKAFWVPRYYTWGGKRVVCSTTYPNKQMRLFHAHVAKAFIRRVHERIELVPDAAVGVLEHYMVVPLDTTPGTLWRKWDRYIAIGNEGQPDLSMVAFVRVTVRHCRPSVLFALRHIRILLFCRGSRLPAWRELAEHWYNFKVIQEAWKLVRFGRTYT